MPWIPTFSAQFIKPLLQQTVALIQRDQADAIAYVNPDLQAIQEFHFGRGARTAMPWLAISGDGPQFIRDDDLEYRKGVCVISLDLDVGDFNQETAQFTANDYIRVLDEIISSAGPSPALQDWTTALPISQEAVPSGTTIPPAVGTVKDVIVLSHRYTAVRADDYPAPILRATLNFEIHLIEG